MNLAMALTATLMKDDVDTELLKDSLISEAKNAIKEFVLDSGADDEEDEIQYSCILHLTYFLYVTYIQYYKYEISIKLQT